MPSRSSAYSPTICRPEVRECFGSGERHHHRCPVPTNSTARCLRVPAQRRPERQKFLCSHAGHPQAQSIWRYGWWTDPERQVILLLHVSRNTHHQRARRRHRLRAERRRAQRKFCRLRHYRQRPDHGRAISRQSDSLEPLQRTVAVLPPTYSFAHPAQWGNHFPRTDRPAERRPAHAQVRLHLRQEPAQRPLFLRKLQPASGPRGGPGQPAGHRRQRHRSASAHCGD